MQTKNNNNYRVSSDFNIKSPEDWLSLYIGVMGAIVLIYAADWACRSWLGFSLTAFLPGGVA